MPHADGLGAGGPDHLYPASATSEAYELDQASQSGWSVTAIGPSSEVTDPGDLARLRTIGLTSWAPGARDHFIRISPVMLNGRHLRADSTQPVQ